MRAPRNPTADRTQAPCISDASPTQVFCAPNTDQTQAPSMRPHCRPHANPHALLARARHKRHAIPTRTRRGRHTIPIRTACVPNASPMRIQREQRASLTRISRTSSTPPIRSLPVPTLIPAPHAVRAPSHLPSHTSRIPLYTLAKSCDYAGRHSPAAGKPLQ